MSSRELTVWEIFAGKFSGGNLPRTVGTPVGVSCNSKKITSKCLNINVI